SQALAPEPDFVVNTVTTDVQSVPDVAMGVDGSFLVTWQSGDGASDDIHAQPFGICAEPVGPEFIVNSYTTGEQTAPQVATDAHGQLRVAWRGPSPGVGAADDVHAQILGYSLCGNGLLDSGEQCDDGARVDGDGCSADCQCESQYDYDGDGIPDACDNCV